MAHPLRNDTVYLIVTVLKTKNTYRLVKFQPTSLKPNEFCLPFRVTIDEKEWFNRIAETMNLGKISPPEVKKMEDIGVIISKPTSEIVMDRLAGRPEEFYAKRVSGKVPRSD